MLGRKMHLGTVIMYTVLAIIVSKFIPDVHWIHFLNAGLLSSVLFHLLEWKYDWTEQEDIDNV